MTKTLTEQWRDGTLEESMYYVKLPDNDIQIVNLYQLKQLALVNDADEIEVLAAVPRYEQYIGLIDDSKELDKAYDKINLLEKRLEIATKALEEYATNESYKLCVVYCHYGEPVRASDVAIQALKEMEGE